MTMADTIAVMNGGRVEQLGAPADLYEHPATTFVANFLGQSNLLPAEVTGGEGGDLLLTVAGARLAVPKARCSTSARQVHLGVRPEKITIEHGSAEVADGRNRLAGTVLDSSFIGVSTQYVVRTDGGHEVTVFEQNMERDARIVPGAPVVLHWNPAHSFALDAAQAIDAGTAEEAA